MGDRGATWRRPFAPVPRFDVALGIAVSLLTQVEVWRQRGDPVAVKAVISAALLGATLSLIWRRRVALWCALAVGLALGVQSAISSTDYESLGTTLAIIVGLYSAGAFLDAPRSLVACAAVVVGLGARELHDLDSYRENPWDGAFWWLLITVLFGSGVYLRSRRRAYQLTAQADRAEAAAVELTREAVEEERARIARELHDVVAHDVSAVIVQADAAEELLRSDPERALESVRTIQRMSREALGQMRQALGIVRHEDPGADPAPQPSLDDLPTLIERSRATGLPVELRVAGERRPLPPGLELSVYRVAQEALTNVRKHAGDPPTSVVLEYGRNSVRVTITNEPGATATVNVPGGHGLLGIQERVKLFKGRLVAGMRADGGWIMDVTFPVDAL
jgi:signal transduction histidine kinase